MLIGTSTGAIVALMYTWLRVRGAGSKQVAKLTQKEISTNPLLAKPYFRIHQGTSKQPGCS